MSRAIDPAAADALRRCEAGELSPEMALLELLIATEDLDAAERALAARSGAEAAGLAALRALLGAHRGGAAKVADMLRSDVDRPPLGGSEEEGIAFCRRLFDWSVAESEEASVALYSLGSPELLDAATREIVEWLVRRGLIDASCDVLDVGAGIGRLEVALASRARSMVGIDVAPRMVEVARRRTAHLPNVSIQLTDGRDLAAFASSKFGLVLAIDAFPYLVQSGAALARGHVIEAARVLAPGGRLVILNYAYDRSLERDRSDVEAHARAAGMELEPFESRPFVMWSAPAFVLRRA